MTRLNTSNDLPVAAATPAPTPASGGQRSPGFRQRGSVKFLGALRGSGALLWDGGEAAVRYQVDVYQGGGQRSGSGTGDAEADLPEAAEGATRLRLADGRVIELGGLEIDGGEATFETRGALPDLPGRG